MTYALCKKLIAKGNYNKDELLDKIDIFLLAGRITDEQYKEFVRLLNESKG